MITTTSNVTYRNKMAAVENCGHFGSSLGLVCFPTLPALDSVRFGVEKVVEPPSQFYAWGMKLGG